MPLAIHPYPEVGCAYAAASMLSEVWRHNYESPGYGDRAIAIRVRECAWAEARFFDKE